MPKPDLVIGHRRIHRAAMALLLSLTLAATGALAGCGNDGGSDPAVALSAAGERGKTVARDKGCTACHSADGARSTGPTWKGLAGKKVKLEGGDTVTADDIYLARAIKDPRSQVYANIMPAAYDDLDAATIADLIAYIHALAS